MLSAAQLPCLNLSGLAAHFRTISCFRLYVYNNPIKIPVGYRATTVMLHEFSLLAKVANVDRLWKEIIVLCRPPKFVLHFRFL